MTTRSFQIIWALNRHENQRIRSLQDSRNISRTKLDDRDFWPWQAMSASAICRITFVVCLIFRMEFPLCNADKDLNDYGHEQKTTQKCFETCFHVPASGVTNTKVRNQLFLRKKINENQRHRSNIQNEKRVKKSISNPFLFAIKYRNQQAILNFSGFLMPSLTIQTIFFSFFSTK